MCLPYASRVDLDAFVTEHGGEWRRLQQLTGRRRRKLTAAEVDEMVMLYRRAATHLSVVSSRSPDPTLVAWLSRLVLQARGAVTPTARFSWRSVGRFFTHSFPLEVYRSAGWWVSVALGFLTVSGVLIGWFSDEQRALAVVSPEWIDATVRSGFESYYESGAPQNFAAAVWTNNAWLSAISLAGGVLIVPALYVLWGNAFNVGIVGGVMVGHGRSDVFFGLILVHGLLELTCLFIAAGVGLRIAWAWIAPGRYRTRSQVLAERARSAMVVAGGLVCALLISGLIEAFVTPANYLPVPVRLAFGALVWLAFLGYVTLVGAQAAHEGATADIGALDAGATVPAG